MVLKDLVQTPNTQGGHVPNNPVLDGALISDDDDSFIFGGEFVDTLPCAISQLAHGCRCNLVRE